MTSQEREWMRKIGIKLRKLRINKGFTSAESFSNEYGLARGYYWGIENGKHNITLLYFYRLCKIHTTTVEDFLHDL